MKSEKSKVKIDNSFFYNIVLELNIHAKDEEMAKRIFTNIVLGDAHYPFRGLKVKKVKVI